MGILLNNSLNIILGFSLCLIIINEIFLFKKIRIISDVLGKDGYLK